eukprot:6156277-Pleurochrysis_carterae.AAC.2
MTFSRVLGGKLSTIYSVCPVTSLCVICSSSTSRIGSSLPYGKLQLMCSRDLARLVSAAEARNGGAARS